MQEKTKTDYLEELKGLLKTHDWFYDYSDDQREWRKGETEWGRICFLLKRVPMCEIPKMRDNVPEELKKKWDGTILHLSMGGGL